MKNYVAYCIHHKELVCEECCDLTHHKDHNNQIVLLKTAASSFINDIEQKLQLLITNKSLLSKCKDFNLRNSIRTLIIDFFGDLKKHIEVLEKQKLDEFNKVFKDSNFVNIKQKANDLAMKADMFEKFLSSKKNDFDTKNYISFLNQIQEIERATK